MCVLQRDGGLRLLNTNLSNANLFLRGGVGWWWIKGQKMSFCFPWRVALLWLVSKVLDTSELGPPGHCLSV